MFIALGARLAGDYVILGGSGSVTLNGKVWRNIWWIFHFFNMVSQRFGKYNIYVTDIHFLAGCNI